MAINFNEISPSVRASNVFIEMAGERRSLAGLFIPPIVGLVGQYDPLKTGVVDYEPVKVTSKDEVGFLFGFGSHIHRQALRMPNAVFLQGGGVYAFPLPDGTTPATVPIVFAVDAASAGTHFFLVGGELIQVAVSNLDTPTIQGQALADAITANQNIGVTAVNAIGTVTLTAKTKGTAGNEIYIKQNPSGLTQENQNPSGTTVGGADAYMAGGATDPSVESVFFTAGSADKLGDRWYTIFTCPFSDATNLGFYTASGDLRSDPSTKRPFAAVVGYVQDSFTEALAIPATINSKWISPFWDERSWAPAWEMSAAVVGQVADAMNISPARPYKTLESGIEADASVANRIYSENDALYRAGMSYGTIDNAGVHRLGDLALSYRTNGGGGAATDWFELVELTLRQGKLYSVEQLFLTEKYNRGVVVDDESTATADYAIAPKDVVADLTKLINELWGPSAWTKNLKAVIKSLTAEINAGNNGRIDSEVTDDEAKALRIITHLYKFLF